MTLDELLEKTQAAIDEPGTVEISAPGALGAAAVFLVNAAPSLVEAIRELRAELAKERGDLPDPEWERIQKLSDDEVKAELIADGVYKDEAEIAEQGEKFTLRVHEMLRMLNSGKRQGAERVAELEKENKRLLKGLAHIAETCVQDPDTAQFACRLMDGSAETPERG